MRGLAGRNRSPPAGSPAKARPGGPAPAPRAGGRAAGPGARVVGDGAGAGRRALVVGPGEGSVVWSRNDGTAGEPRLAAAGALVPPSPSAWRDDKARGPADWGVRVKPCVVDWDGDG